MFTFPCNTPALYHEHNPIQALCMYSTHLPASYLLCACVVCACIFILYSLRFYFISL